jgi:cyclophilin family peptidyl-prolyl cis-trans isomerase
MNKETIIVLLIGIAFFAGGLFIFNNKSNQKETQIIKNINNSDNNQGRTESKKVNNKNLEKPSMEIDQNKEYIANIETSAGTIKIQLNATETPITVNNFVYLAKNNFYDGVIFHRVIDGFMIQGGDPNGDGTGGPGYKFDDEEFSGEYSRGTIAMANSGPNSNGSQFFIMHQDYPLTPNYVIFGQVIEGLDVVDKIATAEVSMSFSGEMSQPVDPIMIESIIVEEK